jgi:aspartate ammonia-lyase
MIMRHFKVDMTLLKTTKMRLEKDSLGSMEIPENALFGIHSARAKENFPDQTPFPIEWYKAVGIVKHACYLAYRKFRESALEYSQSLPLSFLEPDIIDALEKSAIEVTEGKHFEHFIVPAIQGGAGTSINMNVNEIITNKALQILQKNPGEYQIIDPIESANIYQSTNDVIPTSLKIATILLLEELENCINDLRKQVENLEKKHNNTIRIGYTQMQEAVPSTYGRLFSNYSDALSRDWWRVSKCLERIKEVNIGGGAIGTGLSIPRFFIMQVIQELQQLTKLPVTHSENMQDTTSNLDTFVEIHAILKSHAVNIEKMTSDLRLLSSDVTHTREISIPEKQTGSSIMPGKINPVIPEFAISVAHKVYANDNLITSLCGQGCLDLNAYLPTIGYALIDSLKLLIATNTTIQRNMIEGLQINTEIAQQKVYNSPSLTTALIPYIGYHKAAILAKEMKNSHTDIFTANNRLQVLDQSKLHNLVEPQNLLQLGFSIKDLK